ncbi:hypothetical protein [Flavobacterium hercynium]|uniref:PepSY domain-containing protein n=1 Tax=Flavobacterium hercynium TaxID=387094 RepID=A0A226HA02_9FLAO|nr:hypothetical protein [Flavobacterium hercynium]OXA90471.1 hypothetical protein B0A66_12955 [Flavobacterium hercynium]SMP26433.1 hypothetical protein SAMN06265346_109120 [Flavobacterium hercynium]
MKKVLFLLFIITTYSCNSQIKATSKKTKNNQNKNEVRYFNIEQYKDWEIDNRYSQAEDDKFLKKDSERVQIWSHKGKIQIERSSVINPYRRTYVYDKKTGILRVFVMEFYQISIGIEKTYDEKGVHLYEIDNDKPYKFSLQQLIEKVKKEYDIDLEDRRQNAVADRWLEGDAQKPYYEVYMRSKKSPNYEMDCIIIDGTTGEILFKTILSRYDEHAVPPFDQYLEIKEKKEQEDNAFYKNYKGKNYTKKEWEAFEEEWFRDYEERKKGGNFFLDNIFKKNR